MNVNDGLLQIFNVDHGACALLTVPKEGGTGLHRVLIDCGHSSAYKGAPWYPGAYLLAHGIEYVDLLICTNFDEDHASGVPSLIKHNIAVGSILGNPTVSPEVLEQLKTDGSMGNGIRIIANSLAERRDRGELQIPPAIPGVELSYFWNKWPYWDTENNLSLVAHLDIHGFKFLFPGDMEKDGFNNLLLLPEFASLMSGIDVLIAAHHGRENGKCEAMFNDHGCWPQLVIISDCAKKHQSQETLPYYYSKAKGIQSFRGQGPRKVLTTRSDDYIEFGFANGCCYIA